MFFYVGHKRAISGRPPTAPTGTWNPGLEVSVAASPEVPASGQQRHQRDLQHTGGPRTEQRLSEGGFTPEEDETDSETAPAMASRLQRQQSSMLLLDKVKPV